MPRFRAYFLSLLLSASAALAQEVVLLPEPSREYGIRFSRLRTDLDVADIHVEPLLREPREALRLPAVDTTGARFLTLFYSRDVDGSDGDFEFSVMVVPRGDGLLFYPDLDNDEDLRNDGPPRLLADSADVAVFALVAPNDPLQLTHRTVAWVPAAVRSGEIPREGFRRMTDADGNLSPVIAALRGMSGRRGTFLYDDRPVLARGLFRPGDEDIAVGVYDFNANGRYDDAKDLLMVDLDGDGRLTYGREDSTVFLLTDIFEIGQRRYRLSWVDPYGRGIRIAEATDPPTSAFLERKRAEFEAAEAQPRKTHDLGPDFWSLVLPTLAGDSLRIADLRGQAILLDVWGEWCGPCLGALPILVEAERVHSRDALRIVGLLSSSTPQAAQDHLARIGAEWPQVLLTDALRERFGIQFYPTYLFIAPGEDTTVEYGLVNARFFGDRLRPR